MAEDARAFPDEPWGHYRPPAPKRMVIATTRALARPVLKQLALLVRRTVRPGLRYVDTHLWGLRVRLAAHGNLTEGRLIFVPDAWDRAERRMIAAHLEPGATVVDVGANAGGYVWWVLSLLGRDCRILAVEPDPFLVRALAFNVATNDAENVRLAPVAIGTESRDGVLVGDATNRGENRLQQPATAANTVGAREDSSHTVTVRRLEDVIRGAGLGTVDLLKIDIEGLEVDVLLDFFATAPRTLWPRLLITERKDTPEHDRLEADLAARGYEIARRTRMNIICRLALT